MATPPIHFDRAAGVLEGANAWERLAALALSSSSKVASTFSHRAYNHCANLLYEEHGNDPDHALSRYILDQTPLKLIVHDPRADRLETVTELSILNGIKASSHVGHNVFGTASGFWQDRITALNASAARRRMQ